jgi:hypothetical protein
MGGSVFPDDPEEIPLDNTDFEAEITKLLEHAKEQAKDLEPGTSFTVTIDEQDRPIGVH